MTRLDYADRLHDPCEAPERGIDCTLPIPPVSERQLYARTAQPLAAAPLTTYRAVHDSGPRRLAVIRVLVIHDEEASTARSAAAWFASPRSRASAHECIDALECYQTLPATRIPWAAPGVNLDGYHFELAGFARWTRREWLENARGTIERAAYRAALASRRYKVPLRWLGDRQLERGERGLCTHRQVSRVYRRSDHTDPGLGFPRALLLDRARHHLDRIERRSST